MPRPQNRNLRPNPEALGNTPLESGQKTRPVRIRASSQTLRKFEDLTPAERGELIARALSHCVTR